ncbi:MAG: prenylated flavin chaperone LpdD [Candidatus Krumholzibacteriia bacterium]
MTLDPAAAPPGAPLADLTVGEGRTAVRLTLLGQGRDLLLLVTGGEAHVGAVAVRVPEGGGRCGAFAALCPVPGHREGPLAEEGAALLAAAAGRGCVVVAGIHREAATPAEIAVIVANARAGFAALAARLRAVPPPAGREDSA